MNHGKKFMLFLRELFARAASLGLITPETKDDRNEIPSAGLRETDFSGEKGVAT